MKVLVAGATGYIGSAVVRALKKHGHSVVGLARSTQAHAKLDALGAQAVAGDVRDPQAVATAARDAEGVIYAVQLMDEDAYTIERSALTSIVNALAGSGKPFMYTSGVWYYGDTGGTAAREDDPANPPQLAANRPALERIVLDSAQRDVRAIVIRPGVVYGDNGGIPMMLLQSAREQGAAQYVGDGDNHWPLVHVDDLAELYALALERAKSGDVFNAADGSSLRVREIAEAASRAGGANGQTRSLPIANAREAMGAFADALVLDQQVSAERARSALGWTPRATALFDDLTKG